MRGLRWAQPSVDEDMPRPTALEMSEAGSFSMPRTGVEAPSSQCRAAVKFDGTSACFGHFVCHQSCGRSLDEDDVVRWSLALALSAFARNLFFVLSSATNVGVMKSLLFFSNAVLILDLVPAGGGVAKLFKRVAGGLTFLFQMEGSTGTVSEKMTWWQQLGVLCAGRDFSSLDLLFFPFWKTIVFPSVLVVMLLVHALFVCSRPSPERREEKEEEEEDRQPDCEQGAPLLGVEEPPTSDPPSASSSNERRAEEGVSEFRGPFAPLLDVLDRRYMQVFAFFFIDFYPTWLLLVAKALRCQDLPGGRGRVVWSAPVQQCSAVWWWPSMAVLVLLSLVPIGLFLFVKKATTARDVPFLRSVLRMLESCFKQEFNCRVGESHPLRTRAEPEGKGGIPVGPSDEPTGGGEAVARREAPPDSGLRDSEARENAEGAKGLQNDPGGALDTRGSNGAEGAAEGSQPKRRSGIMGAVYDALDDTAAWVDRTPECVSLLKKFSLREVIGLAWRLMNPITWLRMCKDPDVDADQGEDSDIDRPGGIFTEHKSLNKSVMDSHLKELQPDVIWEIWQQRLEVAGLTLTDFTTWLKSAYSPLDAPDAYRPVGLRFLIHFLLEKSQEKVPFDWPVGAVRPLHFLRGDLSIKKPQLDPEMPPDFPKKKHTLNKVEPAFVDEKTNRVLASTSMFEDPYWRNRLLAAFWPHKDHANGYMIRVAFGKVGHDEDSMTIKGQPVEQNVALMSQNGRFNGYSDKTVVAWEELDGELMEKLWGEVAPQFRALSGVSPDEEYIVAFTLRGMRAGGLLDRTGKGLPGAIWHKDVFADHVAIIYPFCFLKGYNNEITTTETYEKVDPGSKKLAKCDRDVEDSATVETVPEGAEEGFGESICFNNEQTRHRAWPPLNAKREEVERAISRARDWGVPSNAVRAMIHVTIRRKSWTDLGEQLAFRMDNFPSPLLDMFGSVIKCVYQVPFLEQWWFNKYGGFIDRDDRPY
uniref:Uncharacterized protein n=1 Tax=Chromera velia CCMP2878 TaxID=1169474 RepID=A0A0G4GNG2_9ALVE|eukprot:Cvel_22680.t1-p1 / transcript=Cvel_22680.t1 / gene=Cvel_22680 / organism=Chromera_velia_CCMP2878 / gene_product=hypothetical protein / transcript_product=hypothetical protein / location=Cvel_scaffold2256:10917-21697(-) / protein_length=979 / sequence_SO=supercontig / SO=protein_coding / is_pseudo=false